MMILTFSSIDSEDVRLMLWDTAGQEEFDAITKAYYRGTLYLFNQTNYVIVFLGLHT